MFKSSILINALVLLFFFGSCKKEEKKTFIPTLATATITNITGKTAACGGNIISDGGAIITAKGVCWSKTPDPTISDNKTSDNLDDRNFTSLITNLDSVTTYYVRAYATNSAGTGYGNTVSFKTSASLPMLITIATGKVGQYSAIYGGVIKSNGGESLIASGVCWSTSQSPTISDNKSNNIAGTDSFTCFITGLIANTKYYIRAYATNSSGTEYGPVLSFNTKQEIPNIVEDNDGNIYNTVTIGTQTWMKENLKTTKYSDWTNIPNITDNSTWQSLTTPAYCWYNNDSANYKSAYGALYNWYAITTSKNICPSGWHVSTDADWVKLLNYLKPGAGSKIKEAGTMHWNDPNTATNSSGFTATPSGTGGGSYFRNSYNFEGIDLTQFADWWVKYDNVNPEYYELRRDNNIYVDISNSKNAGLNVRCIKD
jgi:uncharacterized protein (TIGR02145 family)